MHNNVDIIKAYLNQHPQLCHASNIIKKYSDGKKMDMLLPIMDKYVIYITKNMNLVGFTDSIIEERVELLNDYYNYIHWNGLDNIFSAQGKFRPTILEEFLFILFHDYVNNYKDKFKASGLLESGSVKAYSNLFFKAKSFKEFILDPQMAVNEKDQDFAIYRVFNLKVNNTKTVNLQVPAIAIEAKTFIDKTMLDGIIATAEKVKSGNPYSMFVAVAETYDVSMDVDPAYSRIDQIYILRKASRKCDWQDIDKIVVLRMFNEMKKHLERPWSDIRTRLNDEGVII